MITLPKEPVPADLSLTGNNLLIMGDYGIGKSGLLASTKYLLADPEDKLRSYPNTLRVTLANWKDHLDFRDLIVKEKPSVPGIGLDTLNVSYDLCMKYCMETLTFAGKRLTHPTENPQLAYPRITHEFTTWVREMTMLGYHVIATCHTNIVEIKDKKFQAYNRYIPSFVGGGPTSTYAGILKIFPIVGFMTIDEVENPAIPKPALRNVLGKMVVDTRADASRIADETKTARVIYFKQDPYYLANNKFGGFPERVVLPERWQDDWAILKAAWGTGERYEISDEPVETGQLEAPVTTAAGLK